MREDGSLMMDVGFENLSLTKEIETKEILKNK